MQVLEIFHRYLDQSSNWAYQLLKGLKKTKLVIAAPIFLNKQFLIQNAGIIKPLLNLMPSNTESRLMNLLRKLNLKWIKIRIHSQINKFDLIHAHFAPTACEYLDLIQKTNKPLLVSFYGYDYKQLPNQEPRFKKLYIELFKTATAIIVEGPNGIKELSMQGCPQEKIHIIPLGVDFENIPKKRTYKKNNQLSLVQVAAFKEKKGQYYSILAFQKAIENYSNINLTFVGSGELKEECVRLVEKLNLQSHIRFIDPIPHHQLYAFLSEFDIFIHPSIETTNGDTEGGAPVILLEALACGLPIISTYHADIPNICIDKKTAYLVQEKDTNGLAQAIQYYYLMDELNFKHQSDEAVNYIRKNFEISICSDRLEKLYQKYSSV